MSLLRRALLLVLVLTAVGAGFRLSAPWHTPPPAFVESGAPVETSAFTLVPDASAQGIGQRGTTSVSFAPNETSTGTTQFLLARLVAGKAIKALTTDTTSPLFVVVSSTAITGDAVYVVGGPTSLVMDATNASGVSGQPVILSVTTAGRGHTQAAMPTCGWIVGTMVDDATTSGSTAKINAMPSYSCAATGAGSGTVTSVAATVPAEFAIAGSPVSTTGTLAISKATQTANTVWAGPVSGGAAQPTFRAHVAADIAAALAGTTATGDLGGTYPGPAVLQSSSSFALSGVLSPTALSGAVNDYNPSGMNLVSTLRLSGGAADRDITGLSGGAIGRIMVLANVGTTNALILRNQSASSSASNRFLLGSDISLYPADTMALQYDSTTLRWRPVGNAIPDGYKIRTCALSFGSMSSSSAPLTADDDAPNLCPNDYGRDWVVTSVACVANTGTMTLTPILTAGTSTSILSSALTCGTGATWTAGTVNGTPTLHAFTGATCASPPCSLDLNLTTVDGTTTYAVVKIVGILR